MKRYTISGKRIKEKFYCPLCKNGKAFTKDQTYNTDPESGDYKECICSVCHTKYKLKYIPLRGFKLQEGIAHRTSKDEMKEFRHKHVGLTSNNKVLHMISIVENYKKEAKKMEPVIAKMREEYNNTGVCKNHMWVESKPFKTSEGTFTIKNCAICRLGRVTHNGVTYEDDIMKLVGYVADMGIMNDKKQEEIDNLFKVDEAVVNKIKKQLQGDVLPEPNFELDIPVF